MNKSKQLIKNTIILSFGNLSTKILTFLLLPLYTAVLSTDDYGLIDVLITFSGLLVPFVTMEMGSGVFRFLIEKETILEKKQVISTGIISSLVGISISTILILIVSVFYKIPHFTAFLMYYSTTSLLVIVSNIIRGFGNNVLYSFSNFIITLSSLILNVIFIVCLKKGAVSILISASIGNTIGISLMIIGEKLWKYIAVKNFDKITYKDITEYTLPLIPNTVSWWVVSASDRLIILLFLGASANGIYAISNKIPGIYATLFTVYNLAWTESVLRNESDSFFVENTFHKSVTIMSYTILGIIICTSLFFNKLIGPNYQDSYWHIFILLISIFLSSCSSLLGAILSAKYKSKMIMKTTIVGALLNILLNFVGIKIIDLYAASLSTLISYFVILCVRLNNCKQWYNLKLYKREDILFIPLIVLTIFSFSIRNIWLNITSIFCIVLLFSIQNYKSILSGFKLLLNKIQNLKRN
ncbi:lipopolysaccharide biosynthesis protein [Anaerococcus tetradius]|uniref:Polysaccharide biosynthesis protein n=1 Tax=Anaerococcus tetradius ATCC 35098 TaxID=525255 RepID=C2CI30_9FIRM|nr:oligosaccharide flippase family protein [Anaerococcus tetradius]EEI82825.1 polysaccharide biosynthesis protein [Anaerococcus tetradius ATCC 35098]